MRFLIYLLISYFSIALIAQWIERYPPEVKVAGSNPAECTYFFHVVIKWFCLLMIQSTNNTFVKASLLASLKNEMIEFFPYKSYYKI